MLVKGATGGLSSGLETQFMLVYIFGIMDAFQILVKFSVMEIYKDLILHCNV